jgi:hypothetical protein
VGRSIAFQMQIGWIGGAELQQRISIIVRLLHFAGRCKAKAVRVTSPHDARDPRFAPRVHPHVSRL